MIKNIIVEHFEFNMAQLTLKVVRYFLTHPVARLTLEMSINSISYMRVNSARRVNNCFNPCMFINLFSFFVVLMS